VCDGLIQFLLTTILSFEERVFLTEYVFREGNTYTDLMQKQFAEKFPVRSLTHRNAFRWLTEKFRETGSVLDDEWTGRPSKLNDKKFMDISDSMLRSPSKNRCTSWRKRKISGLQQRKKRSEEIGSSSHTK
jgi:hypothetical protein